MDATAAIEARNIWYSFGETTVLDALGFSVGKDEFVSFIGPSGCGKTTLLYILAGIYTGHRGTLRRPSENVSIVFQHDSLLSWRDALQNVLLPFESRGAAVTPQIRDRALHLLRLVGLDGYEHYYPHQLSGGMKKRVEIARALVTGPSLLILDEPFSSLDVITRERLNVLIKGIHQLERSAVVLVTHSVEEACYLSERIYVLSPIPSTVLQVMSIPNKARTNMEQFLLTKDEQEVNTRTRREAKTLWQPERSVAPALPAAPRDRLTLAGLTRWTRANYNWLLFPLGIAVLFAALTVLKTRFAIPDYIFPHPLAILRRFGATLADGSILPDLRMTVVESLSGFLIALGSTLILGYAIAKSRLLSNLLMPYLIASNTIPSVALAPFLVLWFGFGIVPRIITSVIVIFFPMLINNIAAFTMATESTKELVRFYRPRLHRRLLTFELPAALPVISSGVKVSITLSVIGAVVGEFISGHQGLGALVSRAKAAFDVELMFVALAWLVVLGLTYFGMAQLVFSLIQRRRGATEKE